MQEGMIPKNQKEARSLAEHFCRRCKSCPHWISNSGRTHDWNGLRVGLLLGFEKICGKWRA